MIEEWKRLIWHAAEEESLAISGVRKITSDTSFYLAWENLASPLKYTDICYTPAKGKQLLRNYWNLEEVQAAVDKLKSRKGKDHSSVSIQLRGREKDSRSQGYCMQNMVITVTPNLCTIDIYYRSTELIQKFLADLIFFNQVLPPIFEDLGVTPSMIRFKFANTYLSAVFMPIFLRYEKNPDLFFQRLRSADPKFFRTCGLATRRFFQETHNYTYRTRVKMFEYWKEHVNVKTSPMIKTQKMLMALTGPTTPEDTEEDDE